MADNVPNDNHVVLNQTNALNITFKERKLLAQGSLWHKIIIHNVSMVDREQVLKSLLNSVHPLDLIPVNYKVEGKNAQFIARNCGAAIEKLCRDNMIVQNPVGQSYILTVILGYSNTTETQLNVQSNIFEAIKKRFDGKTGVIDLECFHKDPALSELIFCVLSQPKILYFVLQLCKPLQPKKLKLGNNELRSVNPLEVLWSCKFLVCLDLRNNLIENMVGLSSLKSMQINELWLDGNPVCQNYDEAGYMQAVKEICPTIKKLDGVLLGTEGFLAYRRNYAISHNVEPIIDQFLEHYFTLYDSNNRTYLRGIYHPQALFSISTSYIPGQHSSVITKLEPYKKHSRNLMKLSDFSKTTEQLENGQENIARRLSSLPRTEHDPYTFTVDVLYYTEKQIVLVVTGAFREPMDNLKDTECLYCFSRTFILAARELGEYCIMNEMLHVSNATNILASRAFKNVRVTKPKNTTIVQKAQSQTEKGEFIQVISKVTGLNVEWSKRCLEEAKWDLKKALETFVDFYKLDKIPQDAFRRTETI